MQLAQYRLTTFNIFAEASTAQIRLEIVVKRSVSELEPSLSAYPDSQKIIMHTPEEVEQYERRT